MKFDDTWTAHFWEINGRPLAREGAFEIWPTSTVSAFARNDIIKSHMSKSKKKDKKSRPLPKADHQIPNSMIRPIKAIGLNSFLPHAREYPFHGCWIMVSWQDEGITPVVVARLQEANRIMFGVYMVDLYCLGIKDAFTRADYTLNRFNRELPKFCADDPIPCSVELAHEVIYGALEYAAKLGFQPHPDFNRQMADLILDPPESSPPRGSCFLW